MQKKYILSLKHRFTTMLLIFDQVEHTCNSELITICVITFCFKKVITSCVGKLLHFALVILLYFALMLLHFALVLQFAAIITFCGVTNPRRHATPDRLCNLLLARVSRSMVSANQRQIPWKPIGFNTS